MKKLHVLLYVLCACSDPVHAQQKAALGGEVAGVPHGPTHRPGQPCLVCHSNFSVAGTVYFDPIDKKGARDVLVVLTDSQGREHTVGTNEVGTFIVRTGEWQPVYPMKVVLEYGGVRTPMTADIGRDGACATCHFDPAGPTSPGHVYLSTDGGTP